MMAALRLIERLFICSYMYMYINAQGKIRKIEDKPTESPLLPRKRESEGMITNLKIRSTQKPAVDVTASYFNYRII